MTGRRSVTPIGVALACLAILSAGCGGGGGGGGGTPGPTGPAGGTRFTAASGSGTNSIFMGAGSSGSANTFRLEIRTAGVNDLYSAAFDVEYPGAILGFTGVATEGTFLGDGATTLQVAEGPNDTVIVGVSRLGDVGGVDGSGLLLTLDFNVLASGSGDLRFTNRGAFGPNGGSKPNLDWIGGSITTTR